LTGRHETASVSLNRYIYIDKCEIVSV
jgi:hypothetical protein